MCFLYILPWLRKNVFKRILQRSVRIGFWFWLFRSCSWSVPGLSPAGLLLVLCLALVRQAMPGGVAFMGSLWRSVPDRLAVPGMVPGEARTPRKCTTSQKSNQNRVSLNRKNLKKIAEI